MSKVKKGKRVAAAAMAVALSMATVTTGVLLLHIIQIIMYC